MEQKYLPIGSVCTLKGKSKKVMITGYYSVEFAGNFKIKDYSGCSYPEGMLLPNSVCTFNHTDIELVDFVGYRNEEQKTFSTLLNRLTGNITEEEKVENFHKGNDMFLTSNSSYSKLLFDENGVVMIAEPAKETKQMTKNNNSLNNIKFDENGTVISVSNDPIVNPFHKEYENSQVKKNTNNAHSIFNNIKFDENGTVISVEDFNKEKESTLNDIKFDENGTVISVGDEANETETKKSKFPEDKKLEENSSYEFDENGTVIAAQTQQQQSPTSSTSNYQFDENGTVISA